MAHRTTTHQAYDPRQVQEHIVETPLNEEMSKSFLEYAYSVIYARALPDARDGLKPVQRRIIYQMGEMNLTPDRPYMKSARVVGEVMGKLHPHGDSAIYEAMVRLAQPFAMRLALVDGHGNFGSLDDGPAASRYTEARLAPAALGMNADIDEDTVDFTPNYDNKLKEPTVLPAAIPNLLVNGGSGIAVGMATNMATHNLGEVVAAAKHLMAHPDATLEELMRYVPGPDWPGGGIIIGRNGIREAYETGRGTLTTRSMTHFENVTARKKAIVVTELPFMVGPERVLERISEGVKNRKLEGISGAIDLTDRHNGTRLVIEIKTGFDPNAVLAQLFRHTPLQDNFTMNNVALVDGRPHTMGLKEMLQVWIDHRRIVVRRRSEFRRRKALERLHLVEGLLLAMIDIDEVIQVIRTSDDADAAKSRLIAVFDLDDVQAQYILDLRLRRLTRMSRIELEAERDDLKRRIEELERILASDGTLTPVTPHGDDSVNAAAMKAAAAAATLSSAEADVAAAAAARKAGEDAAAVAALQIDDEPCTVMIGASGTIARPHRVHLPHHHTVLVRAGHVRRASGAGPCGRIARARRIAADERRRRHTGRRADRHDRKHRSDSRRACRRRHPHGSARRRRPDPRSPGHRHTGRRGETLEPRGPHHDGLLECHRPQGRRLRAVRRRRGGRRPPRVHRVRLLAADVRCRERAPAGSHRRRHGGNPSG